MRSVRKLVLAGLAALMLCAMLAASASAVTVTAYDSTTGTTLATNSTYNISSMGASTLTWSFFGFGSTTTTCSGFQATGLVVHPAGFAGSITSAKFTGCHNQNNVTCTSGPGAAAGEMVANNTPWTPGTSSSSPGGGFVTGSLSSVGIGTGPNGYFTIPSACKGSTGDCNVTGAGTAADGTNDHFISGAFTAAWSNNTAGQATITSQAVIAHSSTSGCISSGLWSAATSTVRTGSTVGSGNLIFLK